MKFKVTNHTAFIKGQEEICEDFFTSEINFEEGDYCQIYVSNQAKCEKITRIIESAPRMLELLEQVIPAHVNEKPTAEFYAEIQLLLQQLNK